MKHTIIRTVLLWAFCCIPSASIAQGSDAHWNFDPHSYEFEMGLYFSLQKDGDNVANLSDYEIAAFCNGECRGTATIVSSSDGDVGYMRIRSNNTIGESISFKGYEKSSQELLFITEKIDFVSQSLVGKPSSPQVLHMRAYTPGDVDGDGRITINDVVLTIAATFGSNPDGFNPAAADIDGDARITINDAILIINLTF